MKTWILGLQYLDKKILENLMQRRVDVGYKLTRT